VAIELRAEIPFSFFSAHPIHAPHAQVLLLRLRHLLLLIRERATTTTTSSSVIRRHTIRRLLVLVLALFEGVAIEIRAEIFLAP